MKRIFALLLALLLLAMPLVSCSGDKGDDEENEVDLAVTETGLLFTPEGTTDTYHYVYHNSDEVAIIGYEGADVEHVITVPGEIDGRPVTKISADAFKSATMLTAVTLPDSLVEIESWAFFGCVAMTTINFPASLTTIGDGVFAGCTKLSTTATLTIPDTVTEIGMMAFFASGIQGIKLPVSLKVIHDQMFMNCMNLQTVVWSDAGEEIGAFAFMNCASLTAINVPATLNTVGEYAFAECSALAPLTFPVGATIGKNVSYVTPAN